MSEPLVIKHLSHTYRLQPVFVELNLTIHPGEFLAVLGPSGCGKSTLLRAIAGLVKPEKGTIYLNNRCVIQDGREYVPVERRHVGLVFQDYALFPQQTVAENIAFGLYGWPKPAIQQRVSELLCLVGLSALSQRRPSELSGGQQQRVALARALAPRPRLLLLDEPFANVEANLRQTLGEELQILTRREGVSVLLVTHDRSEAFALADRIAIMEPGEYGSRLMQCGTPEYVYHYPVNRTVAQMGGAVSFIPGEAVGKIAETYLGPIPLVNQVTGKGVAVVRPEMARFIPDQEGTTEIIARQFQGGTYRLLCRTQQGRVFAEFAEREPPALGAIGRIAINEPCWWLVDGEAAD